MKTPSWFLKRNLTAYMLLPLSFIYYVISKAVYFIRKHKSKTTDNKSSIICVGNIFAGGVGKTPMVKLIGAYMHLPVIMRGYGANNNVARKVDKKSLVKDVGDEAKTLVKCGIDVYVGNRNDSINLINNSEGEIPRAIIMDDGFQNPTLKKDISILVFDGKLRLGNGFLLPAGPLREPLSAIKRADGIVIMKSKKSLSSPQAKKFIKKLESYNKPIFYAKIRTLNPGLTGNVIAFAGIGYPNKFFDSVKLLYGSRLLKTIPFPDHYQYTKADTKKLLSLAHKMKARLLTTDKDWVRLPEFMKRLVLFARLDVKIQKSFWIWLGDLINKKNDEKRN